MDIDKNKGKTYYLVNSVKGGCGKTTLSIWLASHLDFVADSDEKGNCCIIDMDLQGSCMVSIMDGEGAWNPDYHYLQELVRGYELRGKKFIQNIEVEKKINFSVVFSSPKQEEKAVFYSGARINYSPIMEYGTFRKGVQRFLTKNEEFKKKKFTNIIFDMPPNADGYSDAALECVLNPKHSVLEEHDKVNLFMVMTLDVSHMDTTINGIKEIYLQSNDRIPDKLFIVFNQNIVSQLPKEQQMKHIENKMGKIKEALGKIKKVEEYQKNIYFLIMNQNLEYADACVAGDGLRVKNAELINGCPFIAYASFEDGHFQELAEDEKFISLMVGE